MDLHSSSQVECNLWVCFGLYYNVDAEILGTGNYDEKNKLFCVWNKKKACEKDVFSLFHVYADLLAGTMLCRAESHDNFKSKSFP